MFHFCWKYICQLHQYRIPRSNNKFYLNSSLAGQSWRKSINQKTLHALLQDIQCRTQLSIWDGAFCKNIYWLSTMNCFCKRVLNASLNFLESWGQILILCMGGICIVGFFTSFLDNVSGLSGSGWTAFESFQVFWNENARVNSVSFLI